MARGLNVVVLSGNLTRDPELRHTSSGTAVCELGMAQNESYKDSSGEWQERTNFVNIVVWGKQGENCAQYLSTGRAIAVQGRLRYESWEGDHGKRSTIKVVADFVQFLGDGKGRDSGGGGGGASSSSSGSGDSSGYRMSGGDGGGQFHRDRDDEAIAAARAAEDDIPF